VEERESSERWWAVEEREGASEQWWACHLPILDVASAPALAAPIKRLPSATFPGGLDPTDALGKDVNKCGASEGYGAVILGRYKSANVRRY
jgi:hypothetical protein